MKPRRNAVLGVGILLAMSGGATSAYGQQSATAVAVAPSALRQRDAWHRRRVHLGIYYGVGFADPQADLGGVWGVRVTIGGAPCTIAGVGVVVGSTEPDGVEFGVSGRVERSTYRLYNPLFDMGVTRVLAEPRVTFRRTTLLLRPRISVAVRWGVLRTTNDSPFRAFQGLYRRRTDILGVSVSSIYHVAGPVRLELGASLDRVNPLGKRQQDWLSTVFSTLQLVL